MAKLKSHVLFGTEAAEEERRVLTATNLQSMEVLAKHGEIRAVIIVETHVVTNIWESLIKFTIDQNQALAPVYLVIDASSSDVLRVQASRAIVNLTGEIYGDDTILYSAFYATRDLPNEAVRNGVYADFVSAFVQNEAIEDSAFLQILSNT